MTAWEPKPNAYLPSCQRTCHSKRARKVLYLRDSKQKGWLPALQILSLCGPACAERRRERWRAPHGHIPSSIHSKGPAAAAPAAKKSAVQRRPSVVASEPAGWRNRTHRASDKRRVSPNKEKQKQSPKKKGKRKNKNPNKKQQKSKLKQQKNVENPLHWHKNIASLTNIL